MKKSHLKGVLNKNELSIIRKSLPSDGYKRVADKTGYDTSTVGKTLREPKHFNKSIIEAAFIVADEYKAETQELKNRVKNLQSK